MLNMPARNDRHPMIAYLGVLPLIAVTATVTTSWPWPSG
jgi:hypothetical protein